MTSWPQFVRIFGMPHFYIYFFNRFFSNLNLFLILFLAVFLADVAPGGKAFAKPAVVSNPAVKAETPAGGAKTNTDVKTSPAPTKASFKVMVGEIKFLTEIKELYKKNELSPTEQKRWSQIWLANVAVIKEYDRYFRDSKTFQRGEIDDENVLVGILSVEQISILRFRELANRESYMEALDELTPWMLLASDLPFDEATLIGLRLSSLMRSLVLDEIEKWDGNPKLTAAASESWLQWSKQLKSPWPVDRVVLSEARRRASQRSLKTAEKVAMTLQKNAYITSEKALEQVAGRPILDLAFIKEIWRTKDIDQMKEEIARMTAMQIRLAARVYEWRQHEKPTAIEQLVKASLLERVPVDYRTGSPFTLTAAAPH